MCQPDEEALQTKAIAGQVTPLVQREETEGEEEEDLTLPVGTTCDEDHNSLINSSLGTARDWRQNALEWLEAHRDRIRNRARLVGNYPIPVGTNILDELNLLNRHFRISDRVSDLGSLYPLSANYRFEVPDFEHFGQAGTPILRKFGHVDLSGLSFLCSSTCPRGRRGADVHGSANPGSREFTIYTSCWDPLSQEYKAFVVMHEAFHASFLDFNHDSYSFESGYPGSSPMTNADSYATFASEVTCGTSARSILPEFNISAIPEDQMVPAMESGDGELQAKRISNQDKEVAPDLQSRINSIHGGGQPLSSSARAFFEPRFGHDFSRIRVHTDAKAAESAQVLNARAFTIGHNVVFGDGQYAPSTVSGRYLLAHELVHTIQQGHYDLSAQHILSDGLSDGLHEHHTNAMAGSVMSHHDGQQLPILSMDSVESILQRESADDESEESESVQVGKSIPIIWFRVNSTEFRRDYQADSLIHFNTALQKVRQHLAEAGNVGHIILHGYASTEGDTAHNQELSQSRADRVKELLVAAGIPVNQITAIGHGPDSSFSDELSWNRRVEVEMIPQTTRINMPEETIEAPRYVCGPDVTAEIITALSNVRSTFGGWTRAVKEDACNNLDSLLTGGYAWDIFDLHNNAWIHQNYRPACATAGATPPCGSSVQVGDECYYAGSANYVVFGLMCKLCFDHYMSTLNPQGVYRFTKSKMFRLINYYKGTGFSGLATPAANFAESQQWAAAGYDGWPSGGTPPAGDRSNCLPLCPTRYHGRAFVVHWYPHII